MVRWVLVVVGMAGLLSACVSSRPLVMPDGRQAQAISCGGPMRTMTDCMAKAGEMCPAGYDVIDQESQGTPMAFSSGNASVTAWGGQAAFSGFSGVRVSRTMVVRCH